MAGEGPTFEEWYKRVAAHFPGLTYVTFEDLAEQALDETTFHGIPEGQEK